MEHHSDINFRVHDKFVRDVLGNLHLAREFLRAWLPKDILLQTDLDSLTALPTSMISEALGGTEAIADLLFQTKISGREALLFFLIEHKSYPDAFTPLQAHLYQACIWWNFHREYPEKKLPLIYTIVLHHGKRSYRYSRDLRDLIDAPKNLVKAYVLKPFRLIDLCEIADESMTGSPNLRAVELVLKHIADQNLLPALKEKLAPLLPNVVKNDKNLALVLLEYIVRAANIDKKQFREFIIESVKPIASDIGETVMSLAETLRLEGRMEGKEEGLAEGLAEGRMETRIATAKRMLALGSDDVFILKVTELTQVELAAIKNELITVLV